MRFQWSYCGVLKETATNVLYDFKSGSLDLGSLCLVYERQRDFLMELLGRFKRDRDGDVLHDTRSVK